MQKLDEWLARSEHHNATIIANRGQWSCRLLGPYVYPDLEPEAVTKALEAKPA
jgi:hypothetical protein